MELFKLPSGSSFEVTLTLQREFLCWSHYFIIVLFTLLQEVHLILGGWGLQAELPLNRRDSCIISIVNFNHNLNYECIFYSGNKAKDIVVIYRLESKVL